MFLSRRLSMFMGVAVVAASLGVSATSASAAGPTGPKQAFVGVVNGKFANAEIRVGCFGPIRLGGTGHVLPGQNVEVLPPPTTANPAGYTGTKAKEIKVHIVVPVSTGAVSTTDVILTNFGVPVALPTSWSLPCWGRGVAVFSPEPSSRTARPATVGVSFVSPGATPDAANAAGPTPPHIVARPTHVMVNQTVKLRGTGFEPASTLKLQECSLKNWIAPENPCLSDNSVTVTTNRLGSFHTTMKAEICPAVSPPTRTERTCHIGVPQPTGVDTVVLEGAAKIVVSWP